MSRLMTIGWLIYRLLINRLRNREGILNLAGGILFGMMWGLMAIGLAVVVVTLLVHARGQGDEAFTRIIYTAIFYASFLLGTVAPLFIERGESGFDLKKLQGFPVTRRELFLLSLGVTAISPNHILYYPMLLAFTIFAVIVPGSGVLTGLLIVVLFWVATVTWGQAVTLIIDRLISGRKSREIVTLITILLILVLSLMPMTISHLTENQPIEEIGFLMKAKDVLAGAGQVLPPHFAVEGLTQLQHGEGNVAVGMLGTLVLFALSGLATGFYVFRNHTLGERGSLRRTGRREPVVRKAAGTDLLERFFGSFPPDIAAMAYKDFRYLLQSMSGKTLLLIVPAIVVIASVVYGDRSDGVMIGMQRGQMLLYVISLYIAMMSSSPAFNSLAWEGSAVDSYFYFPVPLRRVVLGKNVAYWTLTTILILEGIITWSMLRGYPGTGQILSTLGVFTLVILIFTIAGNLLSLAFPGLRDIGTRKNNLPQASGFISIGVTMVAIAAAGVCVVVPRLLKIPALHPVLLLTALAVFVLLYHFMLNVTERLFLRRREAICQAMRGRG